MLHLEGDEAPEALFTPANIVQLTSGKVHQVNRWKNLDAGLQNGGPSLWIYGFIISERLDGNAGSNSGALFPNAKKKQRPSLELDR
jgi:hypothetical protein